MSAISSYNSEDDDLLDAALEEDRVREELLEKDAKRKAKRKHDYYGDEYEEGEGHHKRRKSSTKKCLRSLTKITADLCKKVDDITKFSDAVNPKVEEQINTLSTANQFRLAGFKKQYVLNANVLRDLSQVKVSDPHLDNAIQTLKTRNRVLELADKNPAILQVIDAEEATKGLEDVASGLSKNVREFLTSDNAAKKRRFQSAGSNYARLGVGSSQGYYPQERRQPQSLLSIPTSNPNIRCYGCGGYGHVKRDCARKFQARRYPYW